MIERIDIIVPEAELKKNNEKIERINKAQNFEHVDRTPVTSNCSQWACLYGRGVTVSEYIKSPFDNMREQILNYKWRVENIICDEPYITDNLMIRPDFGALRGTEFPMEIIWPNNQPPKTIHMLKEPEDIDALPFPDPCGGINGTYSKWYMEMKERADNFDVRINGERIEIKATIFQGGGPIPGAFALAGSNLFLWMYTDPDRVHKLMDIVTKSHINCIKYFDNLTGRDPVHPQGLGADASEMISPDMFREFAAPYYKKIWECYPGNRGIHCCGKINHLLDILKDELQINSLDGFGFPADRYLLAEKYGGAIFMSGGPNPVLLLYGNPDEIIDEAVSYIKTVGRNGGYIMQPGGNFAPGTRPEIFKYLLEASERAVLA